MAWVGLFELAVGIGDVVIRLRRWDREFAHVHHTWCGTFRRVREPNYWLEIELREGGLSQRFNGSCLRCVWKSGGEHFHTVPLLYEGEISRAERWLKFRAERALLHPAVPPGSF